VDLFPLKEVEFTAQKCD